MQLEAADGMIPFPTSVPTAPPLLGSFTTACQATTSASVDKVFDVQFDVAKTGLNGIVIPITKCQVPLDTETLPVEVWLRNGSHKGSVAGYSQWHKILLVVNGQRLIRPVSFLV